ncbi:MAG: beta-galactosidase [Pseudomonadota bacterium]|nr:beta-galactosidase [Pseudomonadota bacterium]
MSAVHRRTTITFFALLLLLGLTAPLRAAQAPNDFQWGLVAYHVNFPGYELYPEDFKTIAANGIEWVRIDFAWGRLEPTRGVDFEFEYFDMLVREARANGLRILGTLGNGYNTLQRPVAPLWTRWLTGSQYVNELRDYANATVQRYAADVDAWGLENELHIAAGHVLLRWRFKVWRPAINDEIMVVLSNAVRTHDQQGGAEMILTAAPIPGWQAFLREMATLIDYDAVGLFTYPAFTSPDPSGFDDLVAEQIAQAREASGGKPVIVMETGYQTPTPGPRRTEEKQAEYVVAMTQASIKAGATGIYFYQYLDNDDEWLPREEAFGLLNNDRTPKLAWERYGDVIRQNGGVD